MDMNNLTYEVKNDRIVLCKEGVYFGLSIMQWLELKKLVVTIDAEIKPQVTKILLGDN